MGILKINENLEYQFNFNDSYKDYKYISIKKVKKYKKNLNSQVLTIKHEDWPEFSSWLKKILDEHPPF